MSILQMNLDYAKENNLPIAASYEKLLAIPGGATLFDYQYNVNNYEDAEPLAEQLVSELQAKGQKQFLLDNSKEISYFGSSGPLIQDYNNFIKSLNTIGLTPTEAQQASTNVRIGISDNRNSQQRIAEFNKNFNPGGGFGNLIGDVTSNPLFPVVAAIVLPAIGAEVAASLGTSGATGTAITSAGVQAAQGKSLEDIAKGAAISAAAGTVGGNVASSTGSAAAGQAASQVTGGLLSGSDPSKIATNVGRSLLTGGITNAATEATGSDLAGGLVGSTSSGLLAGKDLESSLLGGLINTGVKAVTAPTTPTTPNATKTSSDVAALYGDKGYTGTTSSGGLMTDEELNALLDEYSNYMPISDPSFFDVGAANAADVANNNNLSLLDEFSNYMPISDPSAFDNAAAAAAKVAADYGDFLIPDDNQTAAEVARLKRQGSQLMGSPGGPSGITRTPVPRTPTSSGADIFKSLGNVGSTILKFAKDNPSIAGSLIGAVTGAIGSKNAPTSATTTSSIDPQIKAEYLANLERAKTTAAGLEARKFADFSPDYGLAEDQVKNLGLGGKGQKTTDEAARLAAIEAGFTPQQIAAAQANRANVQDVSGQLGSQFMGNYFNPFEEQVVQGALGDIERTRQMQEQANRASAISAKAFGGTRQGVVSGMTNEAALRQSGSTAAGLRQSGFNQAAQLGQTDAARQFQAQMANQGVSLTLEQANAQLRQQANLANQQAGIAGAGVRQNAITQMGQLGAQQQNLGLSGANAVMLTQLQRQQLEQQRLDALRNLGSERLQLTSGALGMNIPNLGMSSTTPLYNSTAGNLLSGGLTGAYIGSLLGKKE